MKNGFTLAEVLITLGIIGVVAAITIPTLIQKQTNNIIEGRLKKFYTTINQAVLLSENEFGNKSLWWQDLHGAELDEDGNMVVEASEAEKWFMKYVGKNLNIVDRKFINGGTGFGNANGIFVVYFADGSAFGQMQNHTTRDWVFYPGDPEKCIKRHGSLYNALGHCAFAFNFAPSFPDDGFTRIQDKAFEPYIFNWNETQSLLFSNCVASGFFCTTLIQQNNWTIPDNYPRKVHK